MAACLVALVAIVVFGFVLVPLTFMVLWNIVAPAFNLPHLDFIQAFAIVFIIEIVGSMFKATASR